VFAMLDLRARLVLWHFDAGQWCRVVLPPL
jgi:hypothetical protein